MKPKLDAAMKRLSILLVLALTACSAVKGAEHAERAVTQFHSGYDQEQFGKIYTMADPAFRSASPEKDFLEFMTAVRRKMGKVKSSTLTGSGVNVSTSGTRVSLAYKTDFEEGSGVEQFTWQVNGTQARLLGYNINSPTLVVK